MKPLVAYRLRVSFATRVCILFITTTALLVMMVSAQTTKQGSTKRGVSKARGERVSKQRNETLKICQGVPVPTGYVVVAYMTSSACPHGAYVLRKQDSYSETLAQSYVKPKSSTTNSAPATGTSGRSVPASSMSQTSDPTPPAGGSTTSDSLVDDPFATRQAPKTDAQTNSSSTQLAANSTPVPPSSGPGSRPRRVAASQPRANPAVVVDDEPERPARPPSWAGNAPMRSPVVASSGPATDPGPEEVSEGDVVRVDTSLVSVPVSVLDRDGRFIPDLKSEDFTVFENGVQQSVAYFEPADKPFTVALLLDTSPSTQFHLWQIKEAAIAFAKQLRPQDRVLVVSFNDQVLLLTEVTNDLDVISSVIEQHANMGSATRVYDAMHLVIKERLNKIKGRKAIVVFTDGVDTASYQATYQSTLREVEELDALIYPIQYDTTDYLRAMQGGGGKITVVTSTTRGPFGGTSSTVTYTSPTVTGPNGAPLPGATQADYDRANQYLQELAAKTAGRLYRANDPAQLAQAFSQIAEELRRQYSLGYYPQTDPGGYTQAGTAGSLQTGTSVSPQTGANAGERRQIKVRVNRPNLAVKARDNYIRSAPTSPAQ
ncbi:MAG: VWA domain-containing protein [Acidobacteriota bacterium]|nr:VWA domain-containing protein [Acidobacteriota bacterium]